MSHDIGFAAGVVAVIAATIVGWMHPGLATLAIVILYVTWAMTSGDDETPTRR